MRVNKIPPRVPLFALPGFNLREQISIVADYYGVSPDSLRKGTGRRSESEALAHARAALFYALTKRHKFPAQRVAVMLNVHRRKVEEGAKRHAERIAEFRTSHNIKVRESGK